MKGIDLVKGKGDGEMGRWGDGEMGKWGDRGIGGISELAGFLCHYAIASYV